MTTIKKLTLASRQSPLAMQQTKTVAAALKQRTGVEVEIIALSTRGDEITDRPLADVGGKALFIKGLQQAIADGRADAAVHSLKDMEAQPMPGFTLAAVGFAADRRDVAVVGGGGTLADLPAGAVVGTCSPRRCALLRRYYPTLKTRFIRGNLQTRLAKLQAGEYNALLLAAAGLERLNMQAHISMALPPTQFIPAVGQGLLGVECASDNNAVAALLAAINDPQSQQYALAERAYAAAMQGDCHTALGAYAEQSSDDNAAIRLHVFYADNDKLYTTTTDNTCAVSAGQTAADNIQRHIAAKQ